MGKVIIIPSIDIELMKKDFKCTVKNIHTKTTDKAAKLISVADIEANS